MHCRFIWHLLKKWDLKVNTDLSSDTVLMTGKTRLGQSGWFERPTGTEMNVHSDILDNFKDCAITDAIN